MTYYNLLDKDRLQFTQCNDNFRIRCPICRVEKKFLGHCKMGRNLPSIWSHIRKDHQDIYKDQLDEIILFLNCLYTAFEKQIVVEWPGFVTKNLTATTSSSILIDGAPPRIDRWGKIVEIATFLRAESKYYPNFPANEIRRIIIQASKVRDPRTIQEYFDCVTNYSKIDYIKGEYNVREFCKKVIGV